MDTSLWWVPLLVAGSTLLGVVVTQVMANRRERATWKREFERERARWEREDQARTFEHRRAAYVEFYESLGKMQDRVHMHTNEPPFDRDPDIAEGWMADAREKFQLLELYATPHVSELAIRAISAMADWGQQAEHGRADEKFLDNLYTSDNAKDALREAIRADLGVPDST